MRCFHSGFTAHQTERLIALNLHLGRLEYACIQRARQMVEHYLALGGTVDWAKGEDFELESEVAFYRPLTEAEEQGEQESCDGLVLSCGFIPMPPLKWYFLNPTAKGAAQIFESLYFNWNDGVEGIAGLKDERICWTFHDLHDHHDLTWEDILQIERVWIDVRAIHQFVTDVHAVSSEHCLSLKRSV
jgi:hypothetical protein